MVNCKQKNDMFELSLAIFFMYLPFSYIKGICVRITRVFTITSRTSKSPIEDWAKHIKNSNWENLYAWLEIWLIFFLMRNSWKWHFFYYFALYRGKKYVRIGLNGTKWHWIVRNGTKWYRITQTISVIDDTLRWRIDREISSVFALSKNVSNFSSASSIYWRINDGVQEP